VHTGAAAVLERAAEAPANTTFEPLTLSDDLSELSCEWYVDLSPESATSGEAVVESPALVLGMHETNVSCRMLTERLDLPLALVSGKLLLSGDSAGSYASTDCSA
jgi:hypothetical protein